jgi:hypothetical protein
MGHLLFALLLYVLVHYVPLANYFLGSSREPVFIIIICMANSFLRERSRTLEMHACKLQVNVPPPVCIIIICVHYVSLANYFQGSSTELVCIIIIICMANSFLGLAHLHRRCMHAN